MTWTQPICGPCWALENPNRRPHCFVDDDDEQTCCICGRSTFQGIYIRRDPATVLFPAADDA